MSTLRLETLHGALAIARLAPDAAVPSWATGPGFVSVTRTETELSVMCAADRVPDTVTAERGWQGYRFAGTFDFGQTGVAAAALAPLAEAGVPILMIATFDTDYLFVKTTDRVRAETALIAAGHAIA